MLTEEVFTSAAGKLRPRLRRWARQAVSDTHTAEDVVNTTLAWAWEHHDEWDPRRAQFHTWVATILRSQIAHLRRSQQSERDRLTGLSDASAVPLLALAHNPYPALDLNIDVQRAVATLPPLMRKVAECLMEGLTVREIAHRYHWSIRFTFSVIKGTKDMLAGLLTDYAPTRGEQR